MPFSSLVARRTWATLFGGYLVVILLSASAFAAPVPFFVEASWTTTFGPTSEQNEWNYVVGAPVSAVFFYDAEQATVDGEGLPTSPGWFDVTDNPAIDWEDADEDGFPEGNGLPDYPSEVAFAGLQRRYMFPSPYDPTTAFNEADPHHGAFGTGINGVNFFYSNGLTFRRLAEPSRPFELKMANDYPGFGPGQQWDSAGWNDGVQTHQGPAGSGMFFIHWTTNTTPANSLSNALPPASFDFDVFHPVHPWALTGEGNQAFVSDIRQIPWGDTDGSGDVVGLNFEGDFEALEDNYNKAAGTYGDQTLIALPDAAMVEAYPLGIATWRDGDYNVDGLVDKEDLALFNANFVAGNVNYDNEVNIFDVGTVSDNWMLAGPRGDANADGEVNIFDVGEISDHWLFTEGAAQAVPEPATWLLLVLGAMALAGRAAFGRRSSSN